MLPLLALRNLGRNRRRTLLTLSAMVVSSALLILSLGVFSGMFADMLASATGQYHGHVLVGVGGYQEDRDLFAHFAPDAKLEATLHAIPGILASAPRLRSFGLISHAAASQPAELLGIAPERERQVTTLADALVAGRYPAAGGDALIGQGLARKLGVGVGDELVILTQAADGSIGNDLVFVCGIFATGDRGHDNGLVLLPLPWLQQLLTLPGQVHEIALRLADPFHASPLAAQLAPALPAGLEAVDWGTLLPEMRDAIAAYDVSRAIMVAILYFATGLGILNTFFMSVLERTREFGILMAIGLRPWRIRLLVLTEALLLGFVSLALGLALAAALTLAMREVGVDLSAWITPITYAGGTILPRLTAVFQLGNFLVPAGGLLLVSLFAAWLPARRAARLDPVVALREE